MFKTTLRATKSCISHHRPSLRTRFHSSTMSSALYIPLYEEEKKAEPATVCVTGGTGFVAGALREGAPCACGGRVVSAGSRAEAPQERAVFAV